MVAFHKSDNPTGRIRTRCQSSPCVIHVHVAVLSALALHRVQREAFMRTGEYCKTIFYVFAMYGFNIGAIFLRGSFA